MTVAGAVLAVTITASIVLAYFLGRAVGRVEGLTASRDLDLRTNQHRKDTP